MNASASDAPATQYVLNSDGTAIYLSNEITDVGGEFNNNSVSGTADATSANQLKDTGVFTEAEAYYLGMHVWNTTDNTYALVTGKTDNDTLDIDTDIMVNGEGFRIYHSKFTVTTAGYYLAAGSIRYASTTADKLYACNAEINGNASTRVFSATYQSSIASVMVVTGVGVAYLSANDYVELKTWQNSGAVEDLAASAYTYLQLWRLG